MSECDKIIVNTYKNQNVSLAENRFKLQYNPWFCWKEGQMTMIGTYWGTKLKTIIGGPEIAL